MTDAVKPAASVLSDRVSVTNPAAVTGDLVDRLVRTSVFGAGRGAEGDGALDPAQPRRRGRHPAGVDSRPLPGDGPRRCGRVHGAGDQRARDGLRHGARGHPRGEEAERRRVHLRDRAVGDRLHRTAAARVRGGRPRRRAARGVHRAAVHPGRSRPDQRQEVQQPRPRQGAGRAARADQGRDRRRLLQHRHRHLDARRSRQGDAARAAGSERQPGGRFHRLHPQARAAGRHGLGRRRDRRGGRQELGRPRAARLHERLQRRAEAARCQPASA